MSDTNGSILCAVDGSEASNVALDAAVKMMQAHYHLTAFHTFSEKKDMFLPNELKSLALKERYESELASKLSASSYTLQWESRGERTVKQVLEETCKTLAPTFMVVGYTGRKGCNKRDGFVMCGSNAEFTLRHFRFPTAIIKRPVPAGKKTFVYGIKSSALYRTGLEMLFKMMSPQDILSIFYVEDGAAFRGDDAGVNELKTYYEAELRKHASPDSSFRLIPKYDGPTAQELIIQTMVTDIPSDFICIAPRTKEFSGSFTEKIVLEVPSSIVVLT